MADVSDPGWLDLDELRDGYERRVLSPVEVVTAVATALDRLEPSLNATILRLDDRALEQARESERRFREGTARPLEGVPVPIKDNVAVAGARMTLASRMAPDFEMPMDHALVGRLRDAGAVFVAKTNLPEFGTIPSTENERFGAAHNPWDLERSAGGSSGGAGALVAAGVVAAAHGNDGGGSLRIPAACCGVFSLKPTRGLVSKAPLDDDSLGLSIDGFLTRSVRDNARLLDVIAGSEPGDFQPAPHPAGGFLEAAGREPGRLRIALVTGSPIPRIELHAAHAQAVADTGRTLAGLGHDVSEVSVDWEGAALEELFVPFWANLVAQGMELLAAFGGDREAAEPHNRALHALASSMTGPQFLVSHANVRGWSRRVQERMAEWDVVLMPTLLQPPGRLGAIFEGSDAEPLAPLANAAAYAGFTAACNVTGQPAASLPVAVHEGLPVGVQVAAKPGADALLYSLSAQIERALPWIDRRPPVTA